METVTSPILKITILILVLIGVTLLIVNYLSGGWIMAQLDTLWNVALGSAP